MASRVFILLCAGIIGLLLAAQSARADLGPLGVGPRALAKGGAFTAEAEGPLAAYWNPAGVRRAGGLIVETAFATLQRPDYGSDTYGNTLGAFLGLSWTPVEDDGKPGFFGLALVFEKPVPSWDYDASGLFSGGGTPRPVSVSVGQDYSEVLAAAAVQAFTLEVGGGTLSLSMGLGLGLGFSANVARYNVPPLTSGTPDADQYTGTDLALPGSLGLQLHFETEELAMTFALRYRGVLALSDSEVVAFSDGPGELRSADLFGPPPQEGSVGIAGLFFKRIAYSLELTYVFFDAPDAFPNVVPHNYPVLRFGFEYRIPSADGTRELGLRFGFSQSFIDTDAWSSIYTSPSTTYSVGIGVKLDDLARIDFFLTLLDPGAGVVDEDHILAGIAYGLKL
jgi:hypothetical protein